MPNETLEKTLVVRDAPRLGESAAGERQGTLCVLVGAEMGAAFALAASSTIIGRTPEAEITLEDDGISRRHARIVQCNGHYELEDLGSTNGTYVGGNRVQGRARLEDGARIQLGNTLLRFALQDQIEREASQRIYEMSVRDGLTGVFNRRYFEERLTAEFAFAARHGSALCVLLVDIDHFKRINDTYGHQAGDMVLRRVAAALRNGVRTEDVMARYGGEEFAVLARGIDVIGARMFAERVRLMAERARIEWDGQRIAVTISVGFAHNHAGAAVNKAERLVGAADQALYAAKRAGRNRVEQAASPSRYSAVNTDSGAPPSTSKVIAGPPPLKRRIWDQATAPADRQSKVGYASRPERGPSRPRKS
jgi:two-component system cell cycle response regulator